MREAIRGHPRQSAPITAPTHLEEIGMKQRRARRRDRAWDQSIDLMREEIRGHQRASEGIRDLDLHTTSLEKAIRGHQR
jgi:hypothetical protein